MVDDDGETIAVLGAGRISALNATALAWQAEVSLYFFSSPSLFSLDGTFSPFHMLFHLCFKMHNIN